MTQIYSKEIKKIAQNKKLLEKSLKIKISWAGNILEIHAEPEDKYIATQVIEAINLGFSVQDALLIIDGENLFEEIYIKGQTKRHDIARIRGRVIGSRGKALKTLESLTDCIISIKDNTIGIIGREKDVEKAARALKRIISGSKHSSVYSSLEKQRAEEKQSF